MRFFESAERFVLIALFLIAAVFIQGCASKVQSLPEISPLALLEEDSGIYIGIPVKYHKDLVVSLISSQTGLSQGNASTVAGRIDVLYAGLGNSGEPSRIQVSATGSFPSFAVGIALSESSGWRKKNYSAESSEAALGAGYPNEFKYYYNSLVPYKISFPTEKELLLAKRISPLLENYALRRDCASLPYNDFISLDKNESRDILFYAADPSSIIAALFTEMAAGWFEKARGKLSKLSSGDYSLQATLYLKDKNRKTVVKAIMSLAGIPVQEIDETTLKVSNIKVSKKQIETLVSGKL